ncbi:glycoside hydrolase family 3 C-terminal domain-containing protein [[Clostridium] scindens]|uniref:glycoside hydrolase family 3 C-terminal domain-containing protein n=2 Tax=Clostridium scindens (strain JCM 10418 / VPI 12708) TaxID=29347 RepID=UPI001D06DF29|nr:glycoside hydrolase family 3 C-terminal domain-containing protein [[Clostridium] scindens]MCB6286252.1 glycoside hydrolase family 3 C-terminal domain-containing protein [[Clostridium] scindens]MCB6421008.1 glycoside hydrolase family 3 C-terminal domain-containing protein [[Clostridium] scindens]MCB7192767.1 glycoside hydrolase family 3 C-terminal domain-containing protein [[Clostridium] scindens]MCB7285951.1 glycoside hydrolase family 3 C-terminal domain-containing protein [[Clostridium] sci
MKHHILVEQMTMEEKAAILSGKNEWQSRDIPRLNIPSIFLSDGPHGIRKQAGTGDHLGLNESLPATCFPTAATVANSWDIKLGEDIGTALGEEAASQGVHVLLGPGLNIKRSPLCGRNFEYFSEDPYLAGKMAAAYIKGIQSQGVYACPKHFAVNSQELRRMAMNSVLDERTLREIYLTGFEIAVKEGGAKAIMTSYNEVNGTYANENGHLLKDILRQEWGFDGIVVTDWGASNDHVKGVACRSNLEMPTPGFDSAREILRAVEEGRLTAEELDLCVDDLLDAVLTLTEGRTETVKDIDAEAHHALAKRAAAESIVLLKNNMEERPFLPLQEKCNVALIGDFAVTSRYQGAGSSMVNPAKEAETMERLIRDYEVNLIGCVSGYSRFGNEDEAQKKAALDLAAKAEVVIYCFGLNEVSEVEGMDRSHMRIPQNQIELLEAIVKVNPNIVGVLSGGSAIEMPWQSCCKAILHGYLGGQAGAGAMLDVLTGKVNPSGRLAETYPVRYEDTPAYRYFPATERNAEYRESLYVGYRYYDTSRVRVQYPFGFGLSYTDFAYSDIQADESGVTFTLTNTGGRDGAEVAQMYVGLPNAIVFRPGKELKGFAKVFLKAGESKKVRIPFDDKTFRYWNVKTNQWEEEQGVYQIMVGASVSDIRLETTVEKEGTTSEYPYNPALMPYYYTGIIQQITDREFETLLGHPVPTGRWSGELGINDAVCQMYYAKSGLARLIYNILTKKKKENEEKGTPDLNLLFQYNIPFRGIAKMTGGMVSMDMIRGVVLIVNGHFFKGMRQVFGGFFANRKANRQYETKLAAEEKKGAQQI